MRTHSLMLLVTASAVAAVPAAAQQWTWNGRVSAGQEFEVKGVNGSVRAVAGTGSEIEVVASKTARRSDPDEVKFEVVEHRNGITICAIYPTKAGARRPNECQPGSGGHNSIENNDVTVDFEVRVPRGVDFAGRTVNGRVTATGLTGDVRAHTVNGDVRVTTAGTAEASTVNGSIDVAMGRANWDVLEFETVNGSITVELPSSVDSEVHASTVNGGIDTDFPLTVRGKWGPKRMTGTIGRGGRELSLSTVNGSIEIRKGN